MAAARTWILVGLVASAAQVVSIPAAAGEPPSERELVERLGSLKDPADDCDDFRSSVWVNLKLLPMPKAIAEAARSTTPVGVFKQRYSLTEPAARWLLSARLFACGELGGNTAPDDLQREVAQLAEAAKAAPGNVAVLAAFTTLRNIYNGEPLDAALLSALQAAPDPARAALAVAAAGWELHSWHPRLLAFAIHRKPELLPAALDQVGFANTGEDMTAFYLEALRQVLANPKGPAARHLPVLSARTVRNLVAHELPQLAVETFRALPASVRDAIASGTVAPKDEEIEGEETRLVQGEDLRFGLAAALVADNDLEEAKKLLQGAQAKPLKEDEPLPFLKCARVIHRQVVEAHLGGSRPDAFELSTSIETCRHANALPWSLLYPALLGPKFFANASKQLSAALWIIEGDSRRSSNPPGPFDAFFRFALPHIEAARKRQAEQVKTALAGLQKPIEDEPAARQPGADPVAATIARLLGTAPSSPWTEKPLPKDLKPAPRDDGFPVAAGGIKLPRGFWPIRSQKLGKRVAAVALSQQFDPGGEVSGGGYWLFVSRDSGNTWDVPIYTGLRQYQPYVVTSQSELPLMRGDVLQVEVIVREIDEASITYPPIDLKAKREAVGLFLEAKLADLKRDKDGDGLPDLVEERLLTDPKVKDTDGDGVSDANDPMPLVPLGREVGPEPEVISAFLALHANEGASEPLMHGVSGGSKGTSGCNCDMLPKGFAPAGSAPVLFLVADRVRLRGVKAPTRTIVLTPAECESAKSRFGRFYPMSIELNFNDAKDKVFLRFNEGWRGGTYNGSKKDGNWSLEPGEFWET